MKERCFQSRKDIEDIKVAVKNLKNSVSEIEHSDKGEIIANIQLAYRHLEDARMRLGKAIQAYDGGKSCYPR